MRRTKLLNSTDTRSIISLLNSHINTPVCSRVKWIFMFSCNISILENSILMTQKLDTLYFRIKAKKPLKSSDSGTLLEKNNSVVNLLNWMEHHFCVKKDLVQQGDTNIANVSEPPETSSEKNELRINLDIKRKDCERKKDPSFQDTQANDKSYKENEKHENNLQLSDDKTNAVTQALNYNLTICFRGFSK